MPVSSGSGGASSGADWRGQKRKMEDSDSEEEPPDEVRLYEDGFKNRWNENDPFALTLAWG